jgi:hypothetical protein
MSPRAIPRARPRAPAGSIALLRPETSTALSIFPASRRAPLPTCSPCPVAGASCSAPERARGSRRLLVGLLVPVVDLLLARVAAARALDRALLLILLVAAAPTRVVRARVLGALGAVALLFPGVDLLLASVTAAVLSLQPRHREFATLCYSALELD